MQALALRANLTFRQSREITNGLHLLQVQSATGESIDATLARLRADPDVESVDIDQRRFPHAVPNDPLFTGQWYEQATQPAGIDAVTAWDTTTGRSDVVIAELDTGVRYDHPDLLAASANGRLLAGYDFVSNSTIANDGDGRDADASDPGDWITTADAATTTFSGCTVENSSWHGTRVAGILGALSNNATGITGITWLPKILPVRVLGKCGGVDSDILDAMRWAAGLHVTGVPDNTHPAQIINMSLGGTGACTSAEQTVINEVVAAGVTVVISAGNEGGPVDSPANCAGVAGIAGIRQIGTKVGFSSLGPEAALAAPAGNCVNASGPCLFSIDTSINNGTTTPGTNGYTDQMNPNLGTSFSSPIVAGIAGLMTSANGNLKPAQLIARLNRSRATRRSRIVACPQAARTCRPRNVTALRVPAVPAWRMLQAQSKQHCGPLQPSRCLPQCRQVKTSRWREQAARLPATTRSARMHGRMWGPLQIPFREPIQRLQRLSLPPPARSPSD